MFIFSLFVFVSQPIHITVYRPGPVHITPSSRFTIMTSNLFPVSPSLYFGRKFYLFLEAKYNITYSSRHYRPNGPQYHELFVKYCIQYTCCKNSKYSPPPSLYHMSIANLHVLVICR